MFVEHWLPCGPLNEYCNCEKLIVVRHWALDLTRVVTYPYLPKIHTWTKTKSRVGGFGLILGYLK